MLFRLFHVRTSSGYHRYFIGIPDLFVIKLLSLRSKGRQITEMEEVIPMIARFLPDRVMAIIIVVITGLGLAACDEFRTMTGNKGDMSGKATVDDMMAMSMDNMKKVMMMPPDQRKQHVMTMQQKAMAHGQELFGNANLGSNGFNCATCHPAGGTTGGRVPMGNMQMPIPTLEGAANTFPKYKVPNNAVISLAEMNNNCIAMFMKGQPLVLGSRDARDLELFVTNLSKGQRLAPGKQDM